MTAEETTQEERAPGAHQEQAQPADVGAWEYITPADPAALPSVIANEMTILVIMTAIVSSSLVSVCLGIGISQAFGL